MPGKGEVRNMCDVAERLENKGREEGREEGRAEGKLEQLKDLVSKGLLDIAVAASEAGMSENEFSKLMKKYQ